MIDRAAALVDTFVRVDDVTMHLDDGTTEDVDRCVLIVPRFSGVAPMSSRHSSSTPRCW